MTKKQYMVQAGIKLAFLNCSVSLGFGWVGENLKVVKSIIVFHGVPRSLKF